MGRKEDRKTQQNIDQALSEEEVLRGAERLDPNDNSTQAQVIRETAADIQDHRDSGRG